MSSSLMNTSTCSPLKIEAKPSSPLHVNNNIITVPRRYSSSSSSIRCSVKSLRSEVERSLRGISQGMLNSFVDITFRFEPQPYLPTQGNLAPVEEIGDSIEVTNIKGEIPADFPEGVYIRNGGNSPFGALLSTHSVFGATAESWLEGEGMLHAVYFTKDEDHDGRWNVRYKNKYVETDTFKIERQRSRPTFLPVIEGEPVAVLVGILLNQLRFGEIIKQFCNTNVIEHAGRLFATSESNLPHEISVSDLQSKGKWDVNGTWNHRGFTSHPKRVQGTGELVITSTNVLKPYLMLGIITADGKKIKHEVDLGLDRSILCHDFGITERYNVILDMPMVADIGRLLQGDKLIKFEDNNWSRIGVMPRYGDTKSVKWFQVQTYCAFHILNCYEDNEEVVVMGIAVEGRAVFSPDLCRNKNQWFSEGYRKGYISPRLHEWRLNMNTGGVEERFLTGTDAPIEFPVINKDFCGLRNKYAYAQVMDSIASADAASFMFGGLAKLHLDPIQCYDKKKGDQEIRKEIYQLEEDHFLSGASFVPRKDGREEDDGWIISFVHDERRNISQVHIIDCKKVGGNRAVAKITLPVRVPYGFHGNYFPKDRLKEHIGSKN